MSTLSELLAEHTDLPGAAVDHPQDAAVTNRERRRVIGERASRLVDQLLLVGQPQHAQ